MNYFKAGWIDYLMSDTHPFSSLQHKARLEIERNHNTSKSLFHFAYIVDVNNDFSSQTERAITQLCEEFDLPHSLDAMQGSDLRNYIDTTFVCLYQALCKLNYRTDDKQECENYTYYITEALRSICDVIYESRRLDQVNELTKILSHIYTEPKLPNEIIEQMESLYGVIALCPIECIQALETNLITHINTL